MTRAADEIEYRLRLLAQASEVLSSTLDYERTLENVISLALPALADFGFFDVVERNGNVRRTARAHQDPRRQAILDKTQWVRSERTDLNLCGLSSGASGIHPEIDDAWYRTVAVGPEHLEILRALGFCSMITVPLLYQEQRLGALTLFHADSGRHHSRDDLALTEEIARRAAAAVQNARLLQDLQEADRRKDEFLAMLAHELRNPLAPILAAAHVMHLRGDETNVREREVILRQAQHLTRLVDDLLDVSRITRGKIELQRRRVALGPVLARAVELAAPLLDERRQHLQVDAARNLWVDGDEARLAQVFGNLLTNAAKYTDPGGQIRVRARALDGALEVEVSDSGIGIAADHLGRIFDHFFQAESSIDRSRGGLGLGLALVKSLTELHGGRVTVHSDGIGKGSVFRVVLPPAAATVAAAAGAGPSPTQQVSQTAPGGSVLLVDDNQDLANTLADALRLSGFRVQVAYDPPTALKLAEADVPDVAVLDVGLPVMDGHQLALRLKAVAGDRPLRLVALSGYGAEQDRTRSAQAGFEKHLVKPVELDALLAVLLEAGR